jgi:tRNA uridine 5-carboxymethylaminomethyl modification enzyme
LAELMRRPGVGYDEAREVALLAGRHDVVSRETLRRELGEEVADAVLEQAEIALRYAGYIDRQAAEVQRAAAWEHTSLPEDFDYAQIKALSHEVRQALLAHRPQTIGQASRISGVTPAAISLLMVHLKKRRRRVSPAEAGALAAGVDATA